MSMHKRGNVFWIEFRLPDGGRVRESTGTGDEKIATMYHDFRAAQIKGGDPEVKTWDSAVDRWVEERADKRSLDRDLQMARWIKPYWHGRALMTITNDDVRTLIERKRKETSSSTANHYLAFIRTLFNKSVEWGWVGQSITVKPYKVRNQRKRFLSEDEYARLMAELPEHLAAMVEFSVLTGLRQSNVLGLKWSKVDLQRRLVMIDGEDFKNGKDFSAPLGDRALEIIRAQIGKHNQYVFTYRGQPVKQVNGKAWQKSLQRAGIVDFRWHDLRHTFASYHAMNGTPLAVLKALGGWESMEMVNRYAHLSQELVKLYSDNSRVGFSDSRAANTPVGQPSNTPL